MVAQQKMKEEEVDEPQHQQQQNGKQPGSPKSRLAMLKRSSAKKAATSSDPFRFQGAGLTYKGKLIGIRDVEAARGDVMCADAMRDAKAAVKAAGAHKQRITLGINIDGIRIVDEKSQSVIHNFPVSRISFIARDTTDARAFGFVYGAPSADPADSKKATYKFYGIKTAQTADHAVLSIRDMFQIVYEMKRKQVEQMKQEKEAKEKKEMEENGIRSENGVLVADLLDLETELHNIEQGVNQLANIPVVAGDEWPGEQPPTGEVDPFGQQPFMSSPPYKSDVLYDSFGTVSFMSGNSSLNHSQQSHQPSFSSPQFVPPSPAYQQQQQQLLSQSPATLFGAQPSLFPAASTAVPQFWGASPVASGSTPQAPQQQQQQQIPAHLQAFGSAPNFSTTNPFASPVVDPFDTSAVRATLGGGLATASPPLGGQQPHAATMQRQPLFASPVNWNLGNENSAPSPQQLQQQQQSINNNLLMGSFGGASNAASGMPHTHSFQANFSDLSSHHAANGANNGLQWEAAGRKVSSLEEAFTKLVDMDSLVSQPQTKKNPFEHLINPPKVPLNALSSTSVPSATASAPTRMAPAAPPVVAPPPLIFPGKANDPFADDFFN